MINRSHLVALALAVSATNVYAACDASVVSVLSNNQVVLKADCGDGVTGIQWFRDNNSLTGGADVPLGYTTAGGAGATGRDIYFTTTLYPGIHVYKATANRGAHPPGNLATGFRLDAAPHHRQRARPDRNHRQFLQLQSGALCCQQPRQPDVLDHRGAAFRSVPEYREWCHFGYPRTGSGRRNDHLDSNRRQRQRHTFRPGRLHNQ